MVIHFCSQIARKVRQHVLLKIYKIKLLFRNILGASLLKVLKLLNTQFYNGDV